MLDFGFYNMDCMEGMKEFPDNYFDLAIVDPPYGDGGANGQTAKDSGNDSTGTRNFLRGGGGRHYTFGLRKKNNNYENRRNMGGEIRKKIVGWDVAPKQEYFDELFRVSRNQIIWGGNYFRLPPTRCFLIWRKLTISEKFSMAMAEYAWTSFKSNAKVFEHVPQDNTGQRFHPTQKPIALYKWILNNYAQPNDIILDTHVGSASSLIACRECGFKYVGFEIDEDYYNLAQKRLQAAENQMNLFDFINPYQE